MTTQNRQAMQLVQVAICCALLFSGSLYGQAPTITGFTPTSGPVGTLVTLTGTNLASPTSISIGGVQAVQVSNTGTSLVAMVMPGAASGNVSITTAAGTATASISYSVTASLTPSSQLSHPLEGHRDPVTSPNLFGRSVSLSADGNTALIGNSGIEFTTRQTGIGAAWVYVRINGVWRLQAKLISSNCFGDYVYQGFSVSLSADGNTALVGGPGDSYNRGAVWVFVRNGEVWSEQATLVGSISSKGWPSDKISQGYSVSLSADGNTAMVGGPDDDWWDGAVWVFTRNNGRWTQQGPKLVGTGHLTSDVGRSVSLSADGNVALVGGNYLEEVGSQFKYIGKVWIYSRINGLWTPVGTLIDSSSNWTNTQFGVSVSLSADARTALIGGNGPKGYEAEAMIFTSTQGVWNPTGIKLRAGEQRDSFFVANFGASLSADGNTALVGGRVHNGSIPTTYIFERANGAWQKKDVIQKGYPRTTPFLLSQAVALSGDGSTAVVGEPFWDDLGAAWVYGQGITTSTEADLAAADKYSLRLYPSPVARSQGLTWPCPTEPQRRATPLSLSI